MKMIARIRTGILLVLVLAVLIVSACQVFAKSSSPSLALVLKKASSGGGPNINLSVLFVSLLGLSLVTLSFAKGIELLSKKQKGGSDDSPTFKQEVDVVKGENSLLLSSNKELRQENEITKKAKNEIQSKLLSLEKAFRERMSNEEILKRSAANLRKECEKLLDKNEKLTLELNRSGLDILPPAKRSKKKGKAKVKAKVKKKKKIKAAVKKKVAKKRKKK